MNAMDLVASVLVIGLLIGGSLFAAAGAWRALGHIRHWAQRVRAWMDAPAWQHPSDTDLVTDEQWTRFDVARREWDR
jgi:hypothetical protein